MRFSNIQLLRFVAASGVVLYHLGCHAPNLVNVDRAWLRFPLFAGFPVPLFFAVSGFVLAHAARSTPPGRFLFARFLRLYPGYWAAMVLTLVMMRLHLFTEHHRWLVYFVNLTEVSLWPAGPGRCMYVCGVEWSLVYEVFLSVAVAAMCVIGPRRGVAVLTGVWLAILTAKMAAWPGRWFDPFPHGSTIALSPMNVPFLFGVLTYQVRDANRRWCWVVLPATLGLLGMNSTHSMSPEVHWCVWGAAGAGCVWLAVRLRQVSERNPLVRAGDWTYGLYLVHVPLMLVVLHAAARTGWAERVEVLWAAGAVALVGGLAFGCFEAALHAKLRPLAKRDFFSNERFRLVAGRFIPRVVGLRLVRGNRSPSVRG